MTDPAGASAQKKGDDDDQVSLLDLLIVLAKHKWLIVGLPIVVAILAAGISFLLPNIYTATTKIMPPQQGQSGAAAMLAQLGGLAGLAGGVAGIKSPNDLYIGMLKSRTVADSLIGRFNLHMHYDEEYQSKTRKRLEKQTTVLGGKDGIISIEVDDRDPKLAAELANAYVDELHKLTKILAVTEASQRRLFFEHQLQEARRNLSQAESTARQALERGGLVQVEGQGRAMIENTARLRAQITVKEVQIGAMRTYATDMNADLKLAQRELESMQRELARVEGVTPGPSEKSRPGGPSGVGNIEALRNVKYFETIYELFARQYEIAKIDEAKDWPVVQVMDKAEIPDRKSKPKRLLIVALTFLVGLIAALSWAFITESLNSIEADSPQSRRLHELKRYLFGG
jgi:tyrosine-protein kinase Etk/Wzc